MSRSVFSPISSIYQQNPVTNASSIGFSFPPLLVGSHFHYYDKPHAQVYVELSSEDDSLYSSLSSSGW